MTPLRFCALALALLVTSCGPPPSSGPTVVLLVVDGLRADRVPEIASGALAPWFGGDDVLVFERAYAPSSLAEQSLASLFTGRTPTLGGSIGLAEAQPASEALTLATRLRRAGYASAFVSQSSWAGRPGFTRGFGDVQVAPETGWTSDEIAQRAIRAADDWQATSSERPFLLVAHWASPAIVSGGGSDVEEDYGRQIEETSEAIAQLLGRLDESELLADALVVLTAGHGFELLEHGGVGSGWTLDEEVVRVPLMLRGTVLGTGGRSVRSPVSTIALRSTLLEMALLEWAAENEDGAAEPAAIPPLPIVTQVEPSIVLSELVVRERAIVRAVIQDEIKYERILREVPPREREVVARGYEELQAAMLSGAIETPPLFGDPLRERLFLLAERGLGVTELPLAEHVDVLSRARALLRIYQRRCESEGWMPPQITNRLPIDASDMKDLESLGYL